MASSGGMATALRGDADPPATPHDTKNAPDAGPEEAPRQRSGLTGGMVAALGSHADQPATSAAPTPAHSRTPAPHPDIVRHAAAAFNARVTKVVPKARPAQQ